MTIIANMIDVNKITKDELIHWFRQYAKKFGITIRMIKTKNNFCYAIIESKIMILSNHTKYTKAKLAFAFFHELGHFKFGGYDIKHSIESYKALTKKERLSIFNKCLKLERKCDDFGEKESLKYFKNPDCYKPYYTKYGKEVLIDGINKHYKFNGK